MAPNEKMSERASSGLPSACSGDMYAAVPRMMPAPVRASPVGSSVWLEAAEGSLSFASPKSSTFTAPPDPTITLAGLRSRCTMPLAWAAASALAICVPIRSTSASRMPARGMIASSDFPSTCSITMKSSPSACVMSWTVTMCG